MRFDAPRDVLPICFDVSKRLGIPSYLVGGIVRDAVVLSQGTNLHAHEFDFDIVCEGDAINVAKSVCELVEGANLKTHDAFLTAKLTLSSGAHIDFVTARTEVYTHPGALPNVTPSSLSQDLYRRDFTINAMAVTLEDFIRTNTPSLIDPFEGKKALLTDKQLIILHGASFIDDPTRIFRGARYASRFGLTFESQTKKALDEALKQRALSTISTIRILNELKRITDEPVPGTPLQLLNQLGVLTQLPLFTPESCSAIGELTTRLSPDEFCIWLYKKHEKNTRDAVFSSYGFGKKFFKMAQ